jgi:sensor histidine kinase YesM
MLFRKYSTFLLFCMFNLFVFGQYVYTKQYTYENGLPINEILSIHKDSRNYLWVGSRFGVIVKDVETFKLMKRFDKVQFNNVSTITEDPQHNMWFGSYGRGVIKFTGQKYELINSSKGLVSDRVRKLFIYKDLLYVAAQGGVSIIDLKTNKISNPTFKKDNNVIFEAICFFQYNNKIYVATIDHGIYEVTNDKLVYVNNFNRLLNCYIYQNKLYFSTYNGFFSINVEDFFNKKNNYQKINLPNVYDQSFYKKRNVLITASYDINSGNGVVAEFKNNQFINASNYFKVNSEYPSEFIIDETKDIIQLGSLDQGIFEIHLNHFINYSTIDNKKVSEIFSINKNNYYLTPLGLYQEYENQYVLKTSRDTFYQYMQTNKSKYNWFIRQKNTDLQEINYNLKSTEIRFYKVVKSSNSFWISSNIGLFELDFNGKIIDYLPIRPYYYTIQNQQLIVANSSNGVVVFTDLKKLKYTKYADSQSNIPKDVVSITKNEHSVFFASSLDGLFKYENGIFTSYLLTNQFNEDKLRMVKCIGNDKILVATESSKVFVLKLIGEQLQIEKEIDVRNIGGEIINTINIYAGKIVIGTNRNLLIFDHNKLFTLNSELGFINKNVFSTHFNDNVLQLGVENGLYKINFKQLTANKDCNEKLIITGVKVNEQKFTDDKFLWFDLIDKKLTLNNTENNIYLDFSIVNSEFPLNNKYRYRLNPNEKWSEYFSDEFIYLRNLNYGNHKVELEITNTFNNQSKIVYLIDLKIKPPFYLNLYFILLSILTIIGIVYLFYRIKINAINTINNLKINQLNEKSNEENKRLSLERQLTETRLIALQSQMNPHFIFNVLNSIQYYILDNDVDNALNSLGRFSHLIRQMLNLSTKNEVSLNEELDFLKLYVEVENFRWKNKIDLQLVIDKSVNIYELKIPPMIIQPILENAFVHAFDQSFENPTIKIQLKLNENYLEIMIEDNGKGFIKKEHLNSTHESKALKIIEERLQLLNNNSNNLTIDSDNNGTKVTMLFKVY